MNREIRFRAWDGNDTISHKDGAYTYVKADWHPYANRRGYVKRHRLVLESHLGYYLPKFSIVHHKNGNKRDDRIENLEYHPDQKFHAKSHDNGKRNKNMQFVATDPIFGEIKFRLINKHTELLEIHTLSKLIKTTFRNSQFSFAGRYTGLKDKNGVEIYESDIDASGAVVKYGKFILDSDFHYWTIGWYIEKNEIEDGETWKIHTGLLGGNDMDNPVCSIEVIGNIYENPELLK